MALTGSYYSYTYSDHPTDTLTATASYPADLPEGHPDYDKRGTSEIVTTPVQVENAVETEGVYCLITACTINQTLFDGSEDKLVTNNILYNLFTGSYSSSRIDAPNDPWYRGQLSMIPWDYDYTHAESRSLMDYAYDYLKNCRGFVSMSDA